MPDRNTNKTYDVASDKKQDFLSVLKNLDSLQVLQDLLNTIPSAAAILDSNRRAIFVNNFLINNLGFDSIESLFGKRPGEMLGCLHALEANGNCGTTESCRVCGTFIAMKNAQATNKIAFSEMRLVAKQRGINVAREFKVTVAPFINDEKAYLILYLNDISNEKRRLALERIFFHDVLNKVSSLKGLTELIQRKSKTVHYEELLDTLKQLVNDLTIEIVAQRQLIDAENGELIVRNEQLEVSKLLLNIANQIQNINNVSPRIKVEILNNDIVINSDYALLNRIVTNMIKNAVEAAGKNEEIVVKAYLKKDNLIVSVQNSIYMPVDVQLQVFQRSYSTKGEGRGLGTYSIKLLTERYLGGKAYFQSSQNNGTIFYIEIPVNNM